MKNLEMKPRAGTETGEDSTMDRSSETTYGESPYDFWGQGRRGCIIDNGGWEGSALND